MADDDARVAVNAHGLHDPPAWLVGIELVAAIALTFVILTIWPPPKYFEIAVPTFIACALAVDQLCRLAFHRWWRWPSLPQMLLFRDTWRRRASPDEDSGPRWGGR